ncbi:MAG: protein kinase [Acidobacteria bacterium]|nr:protein kinase [Acidobacteriota bacterium]
MAEEPKPNFGKYQVQGILGEGGMGRVWRGYDPDLEVTVAIKELKEQFRDQANLERFYREAQIAAKCRHQNIVLITDLSKTPPYFVMEFLEARELSTYVHKGKPISLTQLVKILCQVCDGLGFLHSRGIYHRDLKPANIMLLKDDVVKVTDFGISKAPFGQATMTQVIMGTIPYMSPEQITSPAKVDGRSDLWALGVIMYELTQRKHPFPGEGDINTIFHIVHSQPAPFGLFPPKVEGPVQQLLTKALQKNPDDRVRSTEEFKVMLQGLLRGVPDPDAIFFPFQESGSDATSTSIITGEELLKAIASRAFVLVEEIETFPPPRKALLPKKVYDTAVDVARMARVLVAEKNVLGLEAVLKDLEAQKGLLDTGVKQAIARVRAEAEAALKSGRAAEAQEAWSKILALDPQDSGARQGLEQATKAAEQEKRDQAHARQEAEARAGAEKQIAAQLRSARDALGARRPQEAQAVAQKILALDPRNEEAKRIVADAGTLQGTLELAGTMRAEAKRHYEAGELEKAKNAWTTVLEVEPADREAAEAIRKIDTLLKERDSRSAGLRKVADAEAAHRAQEYEKALHIYKEAERLAPGEAAIRRGEASAREALESLRAAEKLAAEKERGGDLAGAVASWEKVAGLQSSHPAAGREIERIRGLVRKEEEKRNSEAELRRGEEERRKLVATRQREVGALLETLGAELGAARESLDERQLGGLKDLVVRSRKAATASDLKVLEAAAAEIESARKSVRESLARAAEGVFQEFSKPASAVRDVPEEDHEAIGRAVMTRAKEALARLDAARQKGDLAALREQGRSLQSAAQEVVQKRDALVGKGAATIREAIAALEGALRPNEKNLKDATLRQAREAIARATKDAAGPRLRPMASAVEALKGQRDAILREIQESLRSLREQAQRARAALDSAASKNRRAVRRNADLARRVDAAVKEAAGAASSESVEALSILVRDLEALTGQIPLDPLRFLPHALAGAAVIAAASGFLIFRHVQAGTTHAYLLRVSPWGKIVSIQSEGGASVPPPAGDSPVHALDLVPGKYTIAVENQATSAKGTISVEIPSQTEGDVKLTPPDVKEGVRALLSRDPFFAQAP